MVANNNIGDFLRNYRKENNGMSLRALSEKTGISFSHLSKIERGEHNPSKPTLRLLAKKLELELDDLFIMAGFAPEKKGSEFDLFFSSQDPEEHRRVNIMEKITREFHDADLMFNDLANMTSEQLEEVYEFIKFKLSKNRES
ncbi:helix-turn-helix domain-containing protein [Ornithinibacillus sp. 179-J 7C1 HS]|uniref:helix-turn-helix domain-containing protein n=1 Tax=Ornithinibacillus sp. 179-J 7C1 HS TaxID=3142384 RepID=UPI0039A1FE3C